MYIYIFGNGESGQEKIYFKRGGKYDASADGVLNDKFVLSADTAGNESIDQFDASEKISTNDIDQMMEKLYAKYISNEIPVVIGEFGARDKNGNLQSRVDYAAYYIAAAHAYGMNCNWWFLK